MPLTSDRSDPNLQKIDPISGMQHTYLVLSDEERSKGFIEPVRDEYHHEACGMRTFMARALAETYARDPFFYGGTYCSNCGSHYPIGAAGEFVWVENGKVTNLKVGTLTSP